MPNASFAKDYNLQILLAQVLNAIESCPEHRTKEVEAALREFARECMSTLGDIEENEDAHQRVFTDHVFPNWQKLFFLDDSRKRIEDTQLATLVPLKVLLQLLPDDYFTNDVITHEDIADVTGADFEPEESVGAPGPGRPEILWATTMEDVVGVAPSARDKTLIPFDEARRLRDHLGLVHRGEGADLVLLIFKADVLRTHKLNPDAKISRPFIFEGIGNARFHLFDRDLHAGWNRAFDLLAAKDPEVKWTGGREIVLTSVACTDIERCVSLATLDTPPCKGYEKRVVEIMLDGRPFTSVGKEIEAFIARAS